MNYSINSSKPKERKPRRRSSGKRKTKRNSSPRNLYLVVAGLLIIVLLIGASYKQSRCYEILLDGQLIAQVGNKKEALKVWEDILKRRTNEVGQLVVASGELEFKRAKKKSSSLINGQALSSILQEQAIFLTEACTLEVDGEPVLCLMDGQAVEEILNEYKQRFEPEIDEDVKLLSVDFKEEAKITTGLVDISQLDDQGSAWAKLEEPKIANTIYEIKKGDNFWDIARKNEVTVTELLQLNPEASPEKLMPGQEILIKAGQPQITVVAILETKGVELIPVTTRYIDDTSLLRSDRRVVEEGAPGEKEVVYQITLENGHESTIEVLSETTLKEPTERVVKKGTKSFLARGVGRNYGVVSASRVTSNYGYRTHPIYKTRRFHEGVDLAAPVGRSVHAYTSGTVTFAGRTGGLGLAVYISHGNGLETRYGHLSKINVKKGQKLATGDRIGSVGNTGVSTGPHLHFEVRKNGKAQNPWDYI